MRPPDTTIKYVAYARKSTDDGDKQVNSIPDQLKEIERLSKGLNVVRTITEEKSAKEPGRVNFEEMKILIESGKAQGIICWKINRLARNPIDGAWITWKLQRGVIKHLKTDDGDYYPGSDMLLLYLHFGMSNQYSLNLSKDVMRGMLSKARSGRRPGSAPLGYLNSKVKIKGEQDIQLDPERAPIIRKMIDCILAGTHNAPQALKLGTEEWGLRTRPTEKYPRGRRLTNSSWYNLLQNPFYYGRFQYPIGDKEERLKELKKEWIQGKHEPLISFEEFQTLKKILSRSGAKRTKQTFAYMGLMRCTGCGARITCEKKTKVQQNGNVHEYSYYRCTGQVDKTCKQKTIREDRLEEAMREFLSSIQISPEFHSWAMSEMKKQYAKQQTDKEVISNAFQGKRDELLQMLDGLLDMHLLGKIDTPSYELKKKKLEDELADLKPNLEAAEERVNNWLDNAERLLTFAEKACEEFDNGDMQKRRSIIAALGTEHQLTQGVITFQVEDPIKVLLKSEYRQSIDSGILEPRNSKENITQKGTFVPQSEVMWTVQDSNLRPPHCK